MNYEKKLNEMGIELTEPAKPVASYVPGVKTGNLIFVSGQIPKKDGEIITGRLGKDISIEDAYEAAKLCCISCLSVVKSITGDLDKIKRIVKVVGYVNSVPESGDQPKVVNGASDLLVEVFGDAGKHARAAIGHSGLPLNVPVEVEMIVEVE